MPSDPQAEGQLIDLAGQYILTEVGVKYCVQRSIPMREFRSSRGLSETGFHWKRFNTFVVQRFVAHALLAGIEVQRTDLVSKREEIMKVTKSLIFGILLKKLRPHLKSMLRETPAVSAVVSRVAAPNEALSVINPAIVAKFMQEHSGRVDSIKRSMAADARAALDANDDVTPALVQEDSESVARLINVIDDETWFLLALVQNGQKRDRLVDTIRSTILSFAQQTRISDYVALLLMEFVAQGEQAHFLNLAERDRHARDPQSSADQLLRDPAFRRRLVAHAEENRDFLTLSFRFEGNPHNVQLKTRLSISVTNRGLVGYGSRQRLMGKRVRNVRKSSLGDFFRETSGRDQAEIGALYLQYLETACEKEGVGLETSLLRDERKEETMATMHLLL